LYRLIFNVIEDHSKYNSRVPGYPLVSLAVLFKQIRREIANVTFKQIFPFSNVCETQTHLQFYWRPIFNCLCY